MVAAEQLIATVAGKCDGDFPPRQLTDEISRDLRAISEGLIVDRRQKRDNGSCFLYPDSELAMVGVEMLGYRVAGFSVNADAGATLPLKAIVARLDTVKNGDVIIAHMNKPASESAEGLAIDGDAVGSHKISERFAHATGWSSATIRNVMSELEELGYLEQPHTSAGRIPTDKGYRSQLRAHHSAQSLSRLSDLTALRFLPCASALPQHPNHFR